MGKPRKLCSTNKEALRWCRTRKVTITFCEDKGEGENNIYFMVYLGKKNKMAPTLIKAVNKWIECLNRRCNE